MRERAQELKASGRRGSRAAEADGESDVLARIAEMSSADHAIVERLHAIVKGCAGLDVEDLVRDARLAKDGKVVYSFQSAQTFEVAIRDARLQRHGEPRRPRHGPTGFALEQLTAAEGAEITPLVKKAVS